MAIQPIQIPKQNRLGKALAIGGAIAGGMGAAGLSKGIVGAAQGAGIGQTIGGLVASGPQISPEQQGMQRRVESFEQDPMRQLKQAESALAALPQDQLPQTRQALKNAFALAQQNQKIGMA